MITLVEKLRQLNEVFNESSSRLLHLNDLCKRLATIMSANVYLFKMTGSIFAHGTVTAYHCEHNINSLKTLVLPEKYLTLFTSTNRAKFNIFEQHPTCTYEGVETCIYADRYYAMVPVFYNHKKWAGMLFVRYGTPFDVDDEALSEYISAIISMEILFGEQERLYNMAVKRARSQLAVKNLTYSELKATEQAISDLVKQGMEGTIMLNKISDESFVPHSTVSSALKKLESAGVIETRSKGVKGKHVKITNPFIEREIENALNDMA